MVREFSGSWGLRILGCRVSGSGKRALWDLGLGAEAFRVGLRVFQLGLQLKLLVESPGGF